MKACCSQVRRALSGRAPPALLGECSPQSAERREATLILLT